MIGKNIARLRKEKGYTLTDLAEKANISKSNLSNIEREINQNPSIKVLEKLAEVLDTDLITLLDLQSDNRNQYESLFHRISSLDLTEEELNEYKKIIEFIEWQKKSS